MRAERVEKDIPLNPFTAGVYVANMMATIEVLRRAVSPPSTSSQFSWSTFITAPCSNPLALLLAAAVCQVASVRSRGQYALMMQMAWTICEAVIEDTCIFRRSRWCTRDTLRWLHQALPSITGAQVQLPQRDKGIFCCTCHSAG